MVPNVFIGSLPPNPRACTVHAGLKRHALEAADPTPLRRSGDTEKRGVEAATTANGGWPGRADRRGQPLIKRGLLMGATAPLADLPSPPGRADPLTTPGKLVPLRRSRQYGK